MKGWWESELTDFQFEEPIQIYPTPRDNSALPESVRKRYDAALKVCKTDPGFYAVSIGRMLEAVCRDKGKTKGDLNDRLDELVVDGMLPAPIGALAHQVRSLRNFGAHDNDWDVEERDVPAIEDFAASASAGPKADPGETDEKIRPIHRLRAPADGAG